jgi:curli biogenesis system outer membrane secretion channel CsgG
MKKIITPLMILSLLLACGPGLRYYTNPAADLSYLKRVAILPLHNFTRDDLAHEKIRDILETELLQLEVFEVVDRGAVDAVLRELRIKSPSEVSPSILKKISQELNVQSVLTGAVDEYETERSGNISLSFVAVSLKLIDAKSAEVIWQITASEKGGGALTRLFGVGEKSRLEVGHILIKRCLQTL